MTTPTVIPERLERVQGINLIAGHGAAPNGKIEGCVMDLVSYVAGEPWTDHPACASPVLTSFCIRLNDRLGDEDRQELKPFIPRLVGTNQGKPVDRVRSYMAVDWSVRSYAPRWLRKAGLDDHAEKLEALDELTSADLSRKVHPILRDARSAAWMKREAAIEELRTKVRAELERQGKPAAAAAADAAAAAVAAADAVAAAVAAKGGYWDQYNAAYKAAKPHFVKARAQVLHESLSEVLGLLDRMIDAKAAA